MEEGENFIITHSVTRGKAAWQNVICLLLFTSLVIILQLNHYGWMVGWGLIASFCFLLFLRRKQAFFLTLVLFGVGYYLFLYSRAHVNLQNDVWDILLDRFFLVWIIGFLSIVPFVNKSPYLLFWNKPQWSHTISFPWIWSGFHQVKIKQFLFIAIMINVVVFLPFSISGSVAFQDVIILAFLFSIVNALLEELLWRGVLLSQFSLQAGEKWAVMMTSLGFGLQHYSLGFSWLTCLLFAVGGVFYAGITVRSASIIPALLWHTVFNLLMVWSGIITFSA